MLSLISSDLPRFLWTIIDLKANYIEVKRKLPHTKNALISRIANIVANGLILVFPVGQLVTQEIYMYLSIKDKLQKFQSIWFRQFLSYLSWSSFIWASWLLVHAFELLNAIFSIHITTATRLFISASAA